VNIKFKKFGLSPEDIQQMKNYGILPDKRTLKSLSKAYNSSLVESLLITLSIMS